MLSTLAFVTVALARSPLPVCTLSDGRTLRKVGWSGNDVGPNHCNKCRCLGPEMLACTKMACNEPDDECVICPQAVPECEEGCENCKVNRQTCKSCSTATCVDDKPDNGRCKICPQVMPVCEEGCENCKVNRQTCKSCPKAVCVDDKPDDECVVCPQAVPECEEGCENCKINRQTCKSCSTATCVDDFKKPGCTLSDGETKVPIGWGGKDKGDNSCNTCSCTGPDMLICTQMFCLPEGTCTLGDGETVVPVGWSGNDAGDNSCNKCRCTANDLLACTKKACNTSEPTEPTDNTSEPEPTEPGCSDAQNGRQCKNTTKCIWNKKRKTCKDMECERLTKRNKCKKVKGCAWSKSAKACEEKSA